MTMFKVLSVLAVAMMLTATAHAASVGVSFNRNGDEPFGPGVSAGAVAQTNWNMTTPNNGCCGISETLNSVVDSSGSVVTGMTVSYTARNTWAQGSPNADGNISLLKGYLDDGGNGGSVTMNNISYGTYDVYIYGIGDSSVGGQLGGYTISDGTTTTNADWLRAANLAVGGTMIEGTSGNQGHYFKISGLTGSTLNITNARPGTGRSPLAGFQIVEVVSVSEVPEPATATLSLLGLGGLLLRRRRNQS